MAVLRCFPAGLCGGNRSKISKKKKVREKVITSPTTQESNKTGKYKRGRRAFLFLFYNMGRAHTHAYTHIRTHTYQTRAFLARVHQSFFFFYRNFIHFSIANVYIYFLNDFPGFQRDDEVRDACNEK